MEEFSEKEKLLAEFTISINSNVSDFHHEIHGLKNIMIFFNKESNYWANLNKGSNIVNDYVNYFNKSLTLAREINDNYKTWGTDEIILRLNSLRNYIMQQYNSNTNFKIIYSTSPKANFLAEIYNSNKDEGEAAHFYLLNINFQYRLNTQIIGLTKAVLFEAENEKKLFKRHNIERKAISQLSSEFTENLFSSQKDYDNFKFDIIEWKDKLIADFINWQTKYISNSETFYSEKGKKIDELEDLYTKKLQLSGPVKYWQDRAKKYKRNGIVCTGLLSLTIFFITLLLYSILYNLPNSFNFKLFSGEPQAVRGVVIFFTLISFLAYLIKTFTKLTFSAFHLQRDAEEREQLTLVYLSLIEKGAVNDTERGLILQSLFSRSDTGLLASDSNPTMPGIHNIIDKIVK